MNGIDRRNKVTTFNQRVRGEGQMHAWCGGQQRTVVTHTQYSLACGTFKETCDQIKLTHDPSLTAMN